MVLTNKLIRDILDSTPDATLVIDETGNIVFINKLIESLFGYQSTDLLGFPIEVLLPLRYRSGHTQLRQSFLQKTTSRLMGEGRELFGLKKNGEEFPVEISLSPVSSPSGTLVISAIRDISDRKEIEAQLIAARDSAQKANKTKSRFLATASHDLRQPVQTLRLLNKSLERLATDTVVANIVSQQQDALNSMAELLNALLDISKLESGAIKPDITDFAVSQIFERMRNQFQEQANAKGVDLEVVQCRDIVHSDQTLLGQVVQNLVGNAIRYTHSGKVLLRCLAQPRCVRIEVFDTGIGIPENQLSVIFEEFTQVTAAEQERKNEGLGLGLAIVDRVAKLLNLKVDVESSIGKGSRFSVEVPLAQEAVPQAGASAMDFAQATVNNSEAAKNILLIEDDEAVRDAAVMFLEIEGYKVDAAATIKQALASAEAHQPDILVTDFHLLGTETGVQVIEEVRKALGVQIPAILMSGDTSSVIEKCNLEACDILSKPVDPDQLSRLVKKLLD